MKAIAAALVKAKASFGPAIKNAVNPHLKNRYANLEACLDAVDGPLLKNDIFMYQETSEDASGVTVETIFLHASGEELRCGKLHVPASKQDPQGYGSALTYARRYSLVTACGIAQEDDDGEAGSKPQKKSAAPQKPAPPMTQEQVSEIIALVDTREMTDDQRRKAGVWLKEPQTYSAATKMIEKLKAMPEVKI